MLDTSLFKKKLEKLKGKTIAIVYIFEGDNSSGFEHFYIWKSNIIAKWMTAVQELSCLPLILDVRTFVDKAINNTLPNIDFVINMNSGTYDLSTMALVPSVCSSIGVPCIPCNAVSIVTGENKRLSNMIASTIGLNVPNDLEPENNTGIFRPINLGNSLGVRRGYPINTEDGIYQEFIEGIEITTPLVYNGMINEMEVLPSIAFVPNDNDPNWFYGEADKKKQQGYHFRTITIDSFLKEKYLELAKALSIHTYCRIDARVKCFNPDELQNTLENGARLELTYFIEINVMPTIRDNNSFCYSFNSVESHDRIYNNIAIQKEVFDIVNINSFLLTNSMISYMKNN